MADQAAGRSFLDQPSLLLFLPLLPLYAAVVALASDGTLHGDEARYLDYAHNLLNGSYVSAEQPGLWNGPGYPLLLAPFAFLELPYLVMRLGNAVLLWLAVAAFHAAIRPFAGRGLALAAGCVFGLYPQFVLALPQIDTECLVLFLIALLSFLCLRQPGLAAARWDRRLAIAVVLAGLAMTKVLFGLVIAVLIVFYLGAFLLARRPAALRWLGIHALAMLFCLPWLGYSYGVTGKLFHWGDAGGMNLYWMSSPHAGELGDWHGFDRVEQWPELARNHGAFFAGLKGLSYTEMNDRFTARALHNLSEHPAAFARNWVANIGRLLISYPYSFTPQKLSTLFYLVPNMLLLSLCLFCLAPALLRRASLPPALWSLLLLVAVAFGGNSLLSAAPRMFNPQLVVLGAWIAIVFGRVIRMELRPPSRSEAVAAAGPTR